MPFGGLFKDHLLEAGTKGTSVTEFAKFGGLYSSAAEVTGFQSINSTELEKTAHGYSTGNLLICTAATGGTAPNNSGIVVERLYYCEAVTVNKIKLGVVSGTYNLSWTAETSGGGVAFKKLTEISGGSPAYARIELTGWGTPANGKVTEGTAREYNVNASTTITYAGTWNASTSGTIATVASVTSTEFTAQGIYKVTESVFDINAVA